MTHYKFPKIEQYHQVIKKLILQNQFEGLDDNGDAIYNKNKELPTITFEGRVKLHGSNGAIVFDKDGNFYCQARNRIVTEESDNAGFAFWVNKEGHKIWDNLKSHYDVDSFDQIVIYGEWCGGNVQKGVALNQLEKMFVIFAVRTIKDDEKYWEDFEGMENPDIHVYTSKMIPAYEIDVDLNYPQKAIAKMNEWVDEIDKECPFCKKLFDVSGHGEGIVWTEKGTNNFSVAFKTKGESHSKSKVKKLPTVDPVKLENLEKAVELHCNEDRLEQGWGEIVLTEEDKTPKNISAFVKFIIGDIWDEEQDSLRESNIERKELGKAVSRKAAAWFQNKLQEEL